MSYKFRTYKTWDTTEPSYPSRTRYYQIPLYGLETDDVESLHSYLKRLSHHHSIPISTIIKDIFRSSGSVAPSGKPFYGYRFMNGLGYSAKEVNRVLRTEILGDYAAQLTLLPLDHVISKARLIRSDRAWCVMCLAEQVQNYGVRYEKLIWSLKIVEVCSKHNIPLETRCLSCGNPSSIKQNTSYGRCKCGEWFDSNGKVRCSYLRELEKSSRDAKKYWIDREVRKIIGALSQAPQLFSPVHVQRVLRLLIETFTDGDAFKFSLKTRVDDAEIREIVSGFSLPSLHQLMKIGYALDISPIQLLNGGFENDQRRRFPTFDSDKPLNWKNEEFLETATPVYVGHRKALAAKEYMESALKESTPIPFDYVCQRFKLKKGYLMRTFPTLSIKTRRRYLEYQQDKVIARWRPKDIQ